MVLLVDVRLQHRLISLSLSKMMLTWLLYISIVFFHSMMIAESEVTSCYYGLSLLLGVDATPIRVGGAIMPCDGRCTNTTLANTIVIYGCDAISLCLQFGLHDSCDPDEAQNVRGCCCGIADNCNYPGIAPTPLPNATIPNAIQCFLGISISNSSSVTSPNGIGTLSTCNGNCANMTLNNTTIYVCDPINVCLSLNLINKCDLYPDLTHPDQASITACCCWDDYCNYPARYANFTSTSSSSISMTTTITKNTQISTTTTTIGTSSYTTSMNTTDSNCPRSFTYSHVLLLLAYICCVVHI